MNGPKATEPGRLRLRLSKVRPAGIVAGIACAALGLIAAWAAFVPRDAPDRTYEYKPIAGRWEFPNKPSGQTTHPILRRFQQDWGNPDGDEHKARPEGWKARMTAMTSLARLGPAAVPVLLAGLDDRDNEIRELSAQMLGTLGDPSVVPRLDRAIREDPSLTVRVYAAIGRGNLSGEMPDSLVDEIQKNDPSFIVRARLKLATERGAPAATISVRETLASYDLGTMGTAKVGESAPDISLRDMDGVAHRLSDYRDKKDVALVFVYGVTCFYCTGQMATLKHRIADFESADAQILIVEANEPYRVSATAKVAGVQTKDPRLLVLLDPAHVAAATYGVAMQMNHIEWLNRPSTFLIDRGGILRRAFIAKDVNDRPTPDTLLQELRAMKSEGATATADSPQETCRQEPSVGR